MSTTSIISSTVDSYHEHAEKLLSGIGYDLSTWVWNQSKTVTPPVSNFLKDIKMPSLDIPLPKGLKTDGDGNIAFLNPKIDSSTTTMDDYSSAFSMPDVLVINDNSEAQGGLIFTEIEYVEKILPTVRNMLLQGLLHQIMSANLQSQVEDRFNTRHIELLIDSLLRAKNRWINRGVKLPNEILQRNQEVILNRFGYTAKDNIRYMNIKDAEIAIDDLTFAIETGSKGESLKIEQATIKAQRALDYAISKMKSIISAYEANVNRFSNVKLAEWNNKLYHFTQAELMIIEGNKANILSYTTNNKLLNSNVDLLSKIFMANIAASILNSKSNAAKAGIFLQKKDLYTKELETNLNAQVRALQANLKIMVDDSNLAVEQAKGQQRAYATALSGVLSSLNIDVSGSSQYGNNYQKDEK